jgi:host factor-I protein
MAQSNIQNVFLNELRKQKALTIIYTTNGFQLRGIVTAFDSFTIALQDDKKQHLLYKHTVSTIVPIKPITIELKHK